MCPRAIFLTSDHHIWMSHSLRASSAYCMLLSVYCRFLSLHTCSGCDWRHYVFRLSVCLCVCVHTYVSGRAEAFSLWPACCCHLLGLLLLFARKHCIFWTNARFGELPHIFWDWEALTTPTSVCVLLDCSPKSPVHSSCISPTSLTLATGYLTHQIQTGNYYL